MLRLLSTPALRMQLSRGERRGVRISPAMLDRQQAMGRHGVNVGRKVRERCCQVLSGAEEEEACSDSWPQQSALSPHCVSPLSREILSPSRAGNDN